ncbi:hypothetical protein [Spiroplasma endosymbiont of Polydrusus formosus]|uniref:hypothetical protein n=1 Tax=Spiroplasma endosymbiont of Polydrusus formosus TaxID=3139326 RepID=UPI0035B545F5
MKKILSILWTITLIGTNTTSLVTCNTPQEYTKEQLYVLKEENQINTTNKEIKNNLEWIAPQEKPFFNPNNKWYFITFYSDGWKIQKVSNNEEGRKIYLFNDKIGIKYTMMNWPNPTREESDNGNYFKFVYRWNGKEQYLPNLIIDKDGDVKVNGE